MIFSSDFEERHEQIPDYIEEIQDEFNNAFMRVATAADELYLDNVKIFDVISHQFLVEMYDILGYGLCYEAAALAMMLLKDNPTARLVLGTAENRHETHERCDHAWVEFEENRVPFAVDFAWFENEFCIPRIVHVDICRSIIYHTYSYKEFWQMSLSKKLYALIHERKTSYILPWLYLYRTEGGSYALDLEELAKKISRSDITPTGEYRQYMYFWDHIAERFAGFIPAELKYVTT